MAFWVVIVMAGVCLLLTIWVLYRGLPFFRVAVTMSGDNDDDLAATHFIELLNEAKKSMDVYDDGNDMDGSIYKNSNVIRAAMSKMEQHPDFKLTCYFHFDGNLPFTQKLVEYPNVKIVTGGARTRSDSDVHYKIIDGGRKAHVSQHQVGAKERSYKVFDCTYVPDRALANVTDVLFGVHKKRVEKLMAEAP